MGILFFFCEDLHCVLMLCGVQKLLKPAAMFFAFGKGRRKGPDDGGGQLMCILWYTMYM
jgi:hypothetical protein